MQQKRTAADIAATVFKALPHIDQVWVDEEQQLFHLYNGEGGVLIKRPEPIETHQFLQTPHIQQTK